ncbi:hypothetical protein L9F63_021385, partial [Diploptera punctata]
ESKVELLKMIYGKKIVPFRHLLPRNISEGLEKICQENNYAFVTSTYGLIEQINFIHCSIVFIPQAFFPGSIAIAMVKESFLNKNQMNPEFFLPHTSMFLNTELQYWEIHHSHLQLFS